MEENKLLTLDDIESEDLVSEYVEMFGAFPPRIKVVGFENELYQDLLRKAIKTKQPLSMRMINLYFQDVQYDTYRNTDEDVYNDGLKHRLGED